MGYGVVHGMLAGMLAAAGAGPCCGVRACRPYVVAGACWDLCAYWLVGLQRGCVAAHPHWHARAHTHHAKRERGLGWGGWAAVEAATTRLPALCVSSHAALLCSCHSCLYLPPPPQQVPLPPSLDLVTSVLAPANAPLLLLAAGLTANLSMVPVGRLGRLVKAVEAVDALDGLAALHAERGQCLRGWALARPAAVGEREAACRVVHACGAAELVGERHVCRPAWGCCWCRRILAHLNACVGPRGPRYWQAGRHND